MAEYVNGKELFAELSIYHKLYTEATEKGEAKPQISNTIAHAIIQIATRMANSWNFVGYTYKDEMISDAILKCYEKIHRFDPSISNNSFGFVSQVTWNSFINRIKEEQKQSSVKARMIREKMSSEFVEHGVDSDSDDGSNSFVEFLKENDSYVDYIELKKETELKKLTGKAAYEPHRNKTPYAKKIIVVVEPEFDLSEFEE